MSTVLYVFIAILIFGVLISIHEWGHFTAARLCGVRVLEFSIGMGPLIFQKTGKRDTKISLRALPIGGFCAMEGEDIASDDPAAFTNAAPWKRLIILVAGSFMNFLLGFVLILVCFSQMESFMTPAITGFMEGCPYNSAEALQEGDVFYRINGHRIYFSSDVGVYLEEGENDIVVVRDGERVRLNDFTMVKSDYTDEETGETIQRYGLYFGMKESGLWAKLRYSWYESCYFVRTVWESLEMLVTGAVGVKDMTGVVGIVNVIAETGEASETAFDAFLNIAYLSAFIAINLSVMNMLPLPALDGGRVFFLIITVLLEAILRRRIDPKYEGAINTAGLMLLLGLMAFVMYNDIARIVTG